MNVRKLSRWLTVRRIEFNSVNISVYDFTKIECKKIQHAHNSRVPTDVNNINIAW